MNYPDAEHTGYHVVTWYLGSNIKQPWLFNVKLVIFCSTLVFNIIVNHLQVAVVSDRIDVISGCPKISSPQKRFYLRMFCKNMLGGDAFDFLDHIWKTYVWNGLQQEMNMVNINTYLQKINLIPYTKFQTYVFQSLGYFIGKYFSAVLCRTH